MLGRTYADEAAVVCTLLSNFWVFIKRPQSEKFKWDWLWKERNSCKRRSLRNRVAAPFTLQTKLRLTVVDGLVSSFNNKTDTSQIEERDDCAATHSSCRAKRRKHHSTNGGCRTSALKEDQNEPEFWSRHPRPGPGRDRKLEVIRYVGLTMVSSREKSKVS